ncbi:4-hydroxy-tetrahydrodipicolinate synthase [Verrucomicrobiaceae bacterium R5-34]|uniref:4-hydroxy-tetrahydrodipicolinate synthase n=1 Tax=Oceaniferula flava TaxID=2800421 RepID=A0AAE2SDP8_9BACT|nr:4-hydroxy-tetrahydrodipicolinate synthase [Oceaniferula flavus]MBK1830344.1 4-hydroxy-tetrahydrodipicolinate synthase [Verrucomicrobiaceae bacterium R5-34]MBK1854436.1 4-hydroxy-tetrahydrodipicolinate synthase [Oceaniferula flavus]MBM1135742.1 4-hydroxy-tetrahydrodipicolinate synthase [Oceaniferula flavus]
MFQGTHTALITPFRNGEIDTDAFRALIDRQVAAGVDGIVPCGTTGESPTLGRKEHLRVIELAVEYAAGRIKVIAGTGANATDEAIALTTQAAAMGVDGTLQVCPYYNKPSQEGLYQHYKAIAECSDLPVMLYSIPGRSVIAIEVDTIKRLAADCPTIIANKEAGGDPERITQIREALPDDFQLLSGDDPLTIEFMKRGAVGLVSVATNLIPDVMTSLVRAMSEGRVADAEAIQEKYEPLFQTLMSLDTNPVPIKSAVALQGHCSNELRLPLVNLSEKNEAILKKTLADFDLI